MTASYIYNEKEIKYDILYQSTYSYSRPGAFPNFKDY